MLFNSFEFLLFFPIVLFSYYLLPKKYRQFWLLVASYYFYMGWNASYALLIFFITLVSFAGGCLLQSGPACFFFVHRRRSFGRRVTTGGTAKDPAAGRRKTVFFFCAALILCVLFVFKYLDFFMENVRRLLRFTEISVPDFAGAGLILPVGISFYTFQALGYLIDVYRKEIPAETNFLKYALFVSFFPQLVAGPIERSKNLLRQLDTPRPFDYDAARNGLLLMLWGYFEKICIADTASIYVSQVFADYEAFGPAMAVWATVLFAVQIYCDFGGYSHIAIGAAQVLGIRLMDNFRQPYFAVSVQDFWRRWHISLSTWFRDYVYIPLGGSRCGRIRQYCNLMITFLVSGLWHGASWHFVVWGGLHGIYQIVGKLTKPLGERTAALLHIRPDSLIRRIAKSCVTFVLCDLAWLFFRASGLKQALSMLRYMINPAVFGEFRYMITYARGLDLNQARRLYLGIAVLFFVDLVHERGISLRGWFTAKNVLFRWISYLLILLGFVVLLIQNYGQPASEFIYFQF